MRLRQIFLRGQVLRVLSQRASLRGRVLLQGVQKHQIQKNTHCGTQPRVQVPKVRMLKKILRVFPERAQVWIALPMRELHERGVK